VEREIELKSPIVNNREAVQKNIDIWGKITRKYYLSAE
jgi:hypothetical protein